MNSRYQRVGHNDRPRPSVAPVHRGPQAQAHPSFGPLHHAPNAALLIDFDNVTMGIQKDLHAELRSLLSSDIIKGKVAVQRAYADWRRYPSYIVPLAESSIDMIMAPAYGSSKKNATDIRLAIDAMELVFTRPEIGTFILLSGDSDFASLVIKLKEYGKYVIGVGIRESSSDLLVMNCDEYYSYNTLAGLVRSSEDEPEPRDPWELVVDAVDRMKRQNDVMRSDRLKQVMVEMDPSFDEKDLGMSKFSRFVQEAASRGLLKTTRLDNGQIEVDRADGAAPAPAAPRAEAKPEARTDAPRTEEAQRERSREEEGGRGRRGRRGRGRGRDRERAEPREDREQPAETAAATEAPAAIDVPADPPTELVGERLTRSEAFDLVVRAVGELTAGSEAPVLVSDLRRKARALLGRDSESLSERLFLRILRDAHDADQVDLRKRGDDYEVAMAVRTDAIPAQLAAAASAASAADEGSGGQASRIAASAQSLRRGIRGARGRGAPMELPPELLSLGVVDHGPSEVASPAGSFEQERPSPEEQSGQERRLEESAAPSEAAPAATSGRGAAKKSAAKKSAAKKSAAKKSAGKSAAKSAGKSAGKAAAKSAGKTAAQPAPDSEPAGSDTPAAKKSRGRGRAAKKSAPE